VSLLAGMFKGSGRLEQREERGRLTPTVAMNLWMKPMYEPSPLPSCIPASLAKLRSAILNFQSVTSTCYETGQTYTSKTKSSINPETLTSFPSVFSMRLTNFET